jgi:hypothetical protein
MKKCCQLCVVLEQGPSCSLHLAQNYHHFNLETQVQVILSKSSAVGIILGTGNIGNKLTSEVNVYLSTDAGVSWKEVSTGYFLTNVKCTLKR